MMNNQTKARRCTRHELTVEPATVTYTLGDRPYTVCRSTTPVRASWIVFTGLPAAAVPK